MKTRITRCLVLTFGVGLAFWVMFYRALPDAPLGPGATTVVLAGIFAAVYAGDRAVGWILERRRHDAVAERS